MADDNPTDVAEQAADASVKDRPEEAAAETADTSEASGADMEGTGLSDEDIDGLLTQAQQAEQTVGSVSPEAAQPVGAMSLPSLSPASGTGIAQGFDLLEDVQLEIKIELGRCEMYVDEVLRLSEGAVVQLDKLAGDPVDVLVNDKLVARGEVLVLNDNFCVRVGEILEPGRD